LFNQAELTEERDKRHVYDVISDITGLAPISKIDMPTSTLLAEADTQMIEGLTAIKYFSYIVKTVLGRGCGNRVKLN
jgi:O-antigen biosynthesis protein WbqP